MGAMYQFSWSYNFRKINGFRCGYGWLKRDKIDIIASILMKC